ncbi:hypothetical protein FAJ35_05820 [Streptococcus suis]|uniref:Oligosaccharide repeat unit polymerase n=1 Tax=Streptococcus suis TaxID=1307 RepID=A0A4T2GRV3_STRSU|nr:hypothetical protein [Streptococcus suis]MBY4966244.1 hypothetical protein [Streptococcus suis]TII02099.1 hypothetical protein FAJ35_05820 [Streptococcus suis]
MKIIYDKVAYKWLPYKVLVGYILSLLILSIIGPVRYNFDIFALLMVILYILAFVFFTWVGMAKSSTYNPAYFANQSGKQGLLRLIKIGIILILPIKVLLVVSSIQLMGLPSFSNIFSTLASVYTRMHQGGETENIYRQIDTFCTIIFYFSTFAGIYWRKKMKTIFFFFIIVNISLDLFYNLYFIGTQRSIITIVVLIITLFACKSIESDSHINKRKLKKIVLIISVLLVIFLNILSARKTFWAPSDSYIYNNERFDFSNPLLFWCATDKLKYDVCNLMSYLTQGFYGLSLSFQVPFEWSYMLGSVRGLNSIISQVFPFIPNTIDLTYPLRAGEIFNLDGLANWYSIFPWLASDLTFGGALLYMGGCAWLFMRCWIQSVKYDNPIAFTLLVLLIIQYVFLIANNQLFVQRGESLATVCLLFFYCIYGGKSNFSPK